MPQCVSIDQACFCNRKAKLPAWLAKRSLWRVMHNDAHGAVATTGRAICTPRGLAFVIVVGVVLVGVLDPHGGRRAHVQRIPGERDSRGDA